MAYLRKVTQSLGNLDFLFWLATALVVVSNAVSLVEVFTLPQSISSRPRIDDACQKFAITNALLVGVPLIVARLFPLRTISVRQGSNLLRAGALGLRTGLLSIALVNVFALSGFARSGLPGDRVAAMYFGLHPLQFVATEAAISATGAPIATIQRGASCIAITLIRMQVSPYVDTSGFGDTIYSAAAACAAGAGNYAAAADDILRSAHIVARLGSTTDTILLLEQAHSVELQYGDIAYARYLRRAAMGANPVVYRHLTTALPWARTIHAI